MSIIFRKDGIGWLIDHEEITKKIYTSVAVGNPSSVNFSFKGFSLNKDLFEIVTPFLYSLEAKNVTLDGGKIRRKRKYSECSLPAVGNPEEVSIIQFALKEFLSVKHGISHFSTKPSLEDFDKNNETARKCSTAYFNEVWDEKFYESRGGNNSGNPILVNIKNGFYLVPEYSEFFCIDIHALTKMLPDENKFDFILMDPPWWNKYVRRRKKNQESAGYKMMYNKDVCGLPIDRWLAVGGLVAVWCTNCTRHIQDVLSDWFPKWGLYHVATWYWVKVTRSGEPVCQFSPPPGKQPYERILFGSQRGRTAPQPLDNQCIISVPSSVHSHKPPLIEVMKMFLPQEPRCLELFARYLLPKWTSVGDQVLALQNIKLYSEKQDFSDG